VFNLGALCGGVCFGALSETIGRRRAIAIAAVLVLPAIFPWAHASSAPGFAAGAFVMQFMVQGAWGVVPAHLNELSPPAVRAVLPGFAYQLGNLAMARMAPWQAGIAEARGNDYAFVLSSTIGIAAAGLAVVTLLGPERKEAELKV
jgi:SHS family lactate transporter-like MFS transporter